MQHIRRLRASRRQDIIETEWYNPKKPNLNWRNVFLSSDEDAAAAAGEEVGLKERKAKEAEDAAMTAALLKDLTELVEFKAERYVCM